MIIVVGLTYFIPFFFCFQRLTMNVCLFAAVFIFEVHFLTPLRRVVSKEKFVFKFVCVIELHGVYIGVMCFQRNLIAV